MLIRLGNEVDERIEDKIMTNIRSLFKLKNYSETIKKRIIRDTRNFFEHEEENYYKPVRVGNFWRNNYIEYENNGNRNKTLSIEESFNKIRTYLNDIIYTRKIWHMRKTINNNN